MGADDSQAASTARLEALPTEILEDIASLVTSGPGSFWAASTATSCASLRHAVHSSCCRLVLGGASLPGSDLPIIPHNGPLKECQEHQRPPWRYLQDKSPWQEPSDEGLRERLLQLLGRARCVTSLRIQPQVPWLSLGDVMAAGNTSSTPLAGRLRELSLCGRDDVTDLSPLITCSMLHTLDLSHCGALKNLAPLASCTSLRVLKLCSCPQIHDEDLEPLGSLTSLEELALCGAFMLEEAGVLSRLKSLRRLSLPRCWGLRHISALQPCKALQYLDLDMSPNPGRLDTLDALSGMTSLTYLNCRNLQGLHDVGPLATCTSLEELCLWGCGVDNLQPLSNCKALRNLDLGCARRLRDLGPLHACTALTRLGLRHSDRVTDLAPLACCTQLRELDLTSSEVSDLAPLSACRALTRLELAYATRVKDLTPLTACHALEYLSLGRCLRANLAPLAACTALCKECLSQ